MRRLMGLRIFSCKGGIKVKKTIIANVIIALLLPVIGLVLLLAVHCLPTGKMTTNVGNSITSIEAEFEDELVIDGYRPTMTGNFTDCLMLHFAIYNPSKHSVLDQTMNMYRSESCPTDGEWWPGLSLVDYLSGVSQPREVEYSRYWHGYLVVLKPLLILFSFNSIRLFNTIMQFGLLGMILILLSKKGYSRMAVSLLLATPFMFFQTSFASLSLSVCIYLLLIGLLIQVALDDKLVKINGYYSFFLIMGAMTSYFDFLTYPIVTLGFPLCVYFCMHEERIKKTIINIFLYSGLWGFGYFYMWASKWIMSDVLVGSSTIKDALFTLGVRTGSDTVNYFMVVKKNLSAYMNRPYFVLIVAILFIVAIWMVKDLLNKKKISISVMIPCAAMIIAPFVWWFVTQNHSGQHFVYTCRIFGLSVFAFMCLFSHLFNKDGGKNAL